MDIINLYDNYNSYFNDDFKAIFEQSSKIALKNNYKIYLIGGMVRDLLLNKETRDIDITVEGDAIKFAKILVNEANANILSTHESFGTVKIEIKGQKIDLASTRSESYPKKGHLPHVDEIGCSLEKDVLRRDFTINSLALSLNQESFADLIDYVGGFKDLKSKKIKILHDKSFIDDPTRIIRALKYSAGLGFELDKKTFKLQEEYLANINYDICYKRVKQEIKKTFEQNSQEAFDKFIEQGIYKFILSRHAELVPSSCFRARARITRESTACDVSASYQHTTLDRSRNEFGMTLGNNIKKLIDIYNPKYPWLVYFGIFLMQLHNGGLVNPPYIHNSSFALNTVPNISLTKYEKEVIESAESLKNKTFINDFEIYKSFSTQNLETLLILAILGKKKEVFKYLNELNKIKLHIKGNDLIKVGLKPSKKFGEIFDYVLAKKLKNPALTKAEELNIAKKFLTD